MSVDTEQFRRDASRWLALWDKDSTALTLKVVRWAVEAADEIDRLRLEVSKLEEKSKPPEKKMADDLMFALGDVAQGDDGVAFVRFELSAKSEPHAISMVEVVVNDDTEGRLCINAKCYKDPMGTFLTWAVRVALDEVRRKLPEAKQTLRADAVALIIHDYFVEVIGASDTRTQMASEVPS
jgi:hypothetical protein